MVVAIIMGIVLAVVSYFSEQFHLLRHINRAKFISLTGGIFLTYLILHLLPQLYLGDLFLNRLSVIFVLVGFSGFHLLEKYIYHHEKSVEALRRELKEAHSIAFFIYHFVLGIVLVSVVNANVWQGVLFYIPLLLITAVSSLSLKSIHGIIRQQRAVKLLLSVSTLLGIGLGFVVSLSPLIFSILLGLVVGVLMFITLMDSIPKEKEGNPFFFVLGVALYSLIIGITWIL